MTPPGLDTSWCSRTEVVVNAVSAKEAAAVAAIAATATPAAAVAAAAARADTVGAPMTATGGGRWVVRENSDDGGRLQAVARGKSTSHSQPLRARRSWAK